MPEGTRCWNAPCITRTPHRTKRKQQVEVDGETEREEGIEAGGPKEKAQRQENENAPLQNEQLSYPIILAGDSQLNHYLCTMNT